MARFLVFIFGLWLASAIGVMAQTEDLIVAKTELLMFERPGCVYCVTFHAEIAPQYPLTDEGRAAPLRVLQLKDPLPENISIKAHPVYTPTFVLLKNGAEVGRITGYPGQDFFWPLLAELIASAAEN